MVFDACSVPQGLVWNHSNCARDGGCRRGQHPGSVILIHPAASMLTSQSRADEHQPIGNIAVRRTLPET